MDNATKMTDLVTRDGIKLTARYGEAKRQDSEMPNNWRVTLRMGRKSITTDFFGGSAVREVSAADVLSSLVLDATSGELDFEEFCSEFGYDSDSRKAEKIWRACRKASAMVRGFLGDAFDDYVSAEH